MYMAVNFTDLGAMMFFAPKDGLIASILVIALSLEGVRRTTGWALVIIVVVFILYGLFGDHIPGVMQARPSQAAQLAFYLGFDSNAILGTPIMVAFTIVIAFVIFGALLQATGGSNFFTDLALAMMGRYRGGSAKIAVVGSALFGSISGSAVANVVATGVVTIPMMKRGGYPPHQAAAIEAVASTGGSLMPPVIGVAAFVMAEFLQVSYGAVMLAALIPAVLYYTVLFIVADLEAARAGITRVEEELIPRAAQVLRAGWFFPIPFVVLIYALFGLNLRAEEAALWASASLIVLSMAFGYKGERLSVRALFDSLRQAGEGVLDIVMICCGAGVVIGILAVSGLGFGMTLTLVTIAGKSLIVLLLLCAIVSIILGMGMPTIGVYVLLAALVAPAMVEAGVTPMAAHMFVLYFGMMSFITPPVAVAAFAAASIAKADPFRRVSPRCGSDGSRNRAVPLCVLAVPYHGRHVARSCSTRDGARLHLADFGRRGRLRAANDGVGRARALYRGRRDDADPHGPVRLGDLGGALGRARFGAAGDPGGPVAAPAPRGKDRRRLGAHRPTKKAARRPPVSFRCDGDQRAMLATSAAKSDASAFSTPSPSSKRTKPFNMTGAPAAFEASWTTWSRSSRMWRGRGLIDQGDFLEIGLEADLDHLVDDVRGLAGGLLAQHVLLALQHGGSRPRGVERQRRGGRDMHARSGGRAIPSPRPCPRLQRDQHADLAEAVGDGVVHIGADDARTDTSSEAARRSVMFSPIVAMRWRWPSVDRARRRDRRGLQRLDVGADERHVGDAARERLEASLRATKSVSELTSTATPRARAATPTRPSAAARPDFLAAVARPFVRSQSMAASMSPPVSVSAFLQSIMPAPVFSRRSFTIAAVMSAMHLLLFGRVPVRVADGGLVDNGFTNACGRPILASLAATLRTGSGSDQAAIQGPGLVYLAVAGDAAVELELGDRSSRRPPASSRRSASSGRCRRRSAS